MHIDMRGRGGHTRMHIDMRGRGGHARMHIDMRCTHTGTW